MTLRKVTGVLVGAVAAVLLLASPAFADPQSLTLNPAHKNTLAADFTQECTAPFSSGMNVDGWHFVWQQGGDFKSVTLTFNAGASDFDITINTPVGTPSGNGTWSGFFSGTGGPNSKVKHLYVFTPVGWKLINGVGTGEGGSGTVFNLSHTCAGTPCPPAAEGCAPPPCPDGTCVPPCDNADGCEPPCEKGDVCETPSPSPSTSAATEPSENLPTTGAGLTGVIAAGVGLVVVGTGALLFLRRRRDTTTQ